MKGPAYRISATSKSSYRSSEMLTVLSTGLTVNLNSLVTPVAPVEPPERPLPPIVRVPALAFEEPFGNSWSQAKL